MVLPITLLTIAAIVIIKGFTGATLAEIINGDIPDKEPIPNDAANAVGVIPGLGDSSDTSASAPIAGRPFHSPTHITAGLPGYPAFDYMAPAGTTVISPVNGEVFKLSGKDPRLGGLPGGPLGYSIYIRGTNGKKYYLTHLDGVRVTKGQKVSKGQSIAVVANGPKSWSSPHVHMGVSII